jgi:hypothetical protein
MQYQSDERLAHQLFKYEKEENKKQIGQDTREYMTTLFVQMFPHVNKGKT